MATFPVGASPTPGPVDETRPRRTGEWVRGIAAGNDERLVALAREGDERAFEALYQRHSRAIQRYCRSLLRSSEEAEDVAQEVFVLAITALRRGAEPAAFRPWLYRVAHNACVSHLRARRPVVVADHGVVVAPGAATDPVDGHREELRQLLHDIGTLPRVQRGALLLREMDGFSYQQVGEALGVPPSTVRQSIFRARRTLRGLAAARDADCRSIQSELCRLAARRGRRGRHITSHLSVCPACREFRDALRRRPAPVRGVVPAGTPGLLGAILALKGKLLGGGAAGAGGAALAGGAGGAGVAGIAKFAAVAASSVALIAGAGVEAQRALDSGARGRPPVGHATSRANSGVSGVPIAGAAARAGTPPAVAIDLRRRPVGAAGASERPARAPTRAHARTHPSRQRAAAPPSHAVVTAPATAATPAASPAAPVTARAPGHHPVTPQPVRSTGDRDGAHAGGPGPSGSVDGGREGRSSSGSGHGGRSGSHSGPGDSAGSNSGSSGSHSGSGGSGGSHSGSGGSGGSGSGSSGPGSGSGGPGSGDTGARVAAPVTQSTADGSSGPGPPGGSSPAPATGDGGGSGGPGSSDAPESSGSGSSSGSDPGGSGSGSGAPGETSDGASGSGGSDGASGSGGSGGGDLASGSGSGSVPAATDPR